MIRNGSHPAPPISIIIPVLNDQHELLETIKSIRSSSPPSVQIIVVDDCSDVPVVLRCEKGTTRLIRNKKRVGAGRSRHIGAEISTSNHLLLLDSHMRFAHDWYDDAMKLLKPENQKTLWCATCVGLDEKNMTITDRSPLYYGANLVIQEPNTGKIFEGIWAEGKRGENYEIPCVMGACYFINRDWFLYLGGLKSNLMWGSEEPFLSIKSWLAGGEVRLMTKVRIGHKFRSEAPYRTPDHYVWYNKIRSIMVTLPTDIQNSLLSMVPDGVNSRYAFGQISCDLKDILKERNDFQSKVEREITWLTDKFGIPLPK
jgi:glycosyltransferase involved in cell wall biosynthesis